MSLVLEMPSTETSLGPQLTDSCHVPMADMRLHCSSVLTVPLAIRVCGYHIRYSCHVPMAFYVDMRLHCFSVLTCLLNLRVSGCHINSLLFTLFRTLYKGYFGGHGHTVNMTTCLISTGLVLID